MNRWLRLLAPRYRVAAVYHLTPPVLRAWGIDALMLDLDNTLVPWGERAAPPPVVEWLAGLRAGGVPAVIVSNNLSGRLRVVSAQLGLPAAAGRFKPSTDKLRRALRLLRTPPERTAMVGDQLFMDVLAGNRLGVPTILVTPLGDRDSWRTRVLRVVERWTLAALERRGYRPVVPRAPVADSGR